MGDYLRSLWPALSGTLAMAAVVVAIRVLVPDTAFIGAVKGTEALTRVVDSGVAQRQTAETWVTATRLFVQTIAGAVTYVAVLVLLHRDRLRAYVSLLRTLRKK
jgi:hypothetical protein